MITLQVFGGNFIDILVRRVQAAIFIIKHLLFSLKNLLMVFQHHSVLVFEDVVLNGELGATAGDGEGASGGGDQAVPGDDVHRVGAAGGGGGSPQVLSQVQAMTSIG